MYMRHLHKAWKNESVVKPAIKRFRLKYFMSYKNICTWGILFWHSEWRHITIQWRLINYKICLNSGSRNFLHADSKFPNRPYPSRKIFEKNRIENRKKDVFWNYRFVKGLPSQKIVVKAMDQPSHVTRFLLYRHFSLFNPISIENKIGN